MPARTVTRRSTTPRSAANQLLSKAGSDAAGRLDAAQAERTRLVQSVTSDADTFRRLLPKYQLNPDLFTQQRLVETMGRVLTNAHDKIFLAERGNGRSRNCAAVEPGTAEIEGRRNQNRKVRDEGEPDPHPDPLPSVGRGNSNAHPTKLPTGPDSPTG